MKTMHHFCDNCLNYCSEWMAHLGWSLLSLSEKRHLLSLIYFVPSVQHGTLLLRPPNLVIRLHWVSGGPCMRQLSGHMGRVTFPQQPLPHPLQQCSCMGQPLQNFSYMACQDRFTIYSFGVSEASKQKMCVCVFLCELMLAGEAALPPKPPVWGVAGPLLGYWSRLWTPELSAEQLDCFHLSNFCLW